jgi:tetratricopeptide (TPR) repeat protein
LFEYSERLTQAIFRRTPSQQWPLLRQEAMQSLQKAVKHDPKMGDAYLLMAKLQILPGGSRDQAIKNVDDAIKAFAQDNSKQSEAYLFRAKLVEDTDQKLADVSKAIELDAGNAEALQVRALLYLATGKYKEASEAFSKILEGDEENVAAHQAAAEALVNLDQFDEALKHASRAIELQPDSSSNYAIRARIYAAQEKLKESLDDLNRAIEMEPQNLGAVLYRARIHLAMDNLEQAKEDIDRVLQADPNLAQGLLLRSMISYTEKQYGAAIADIRKVLEQDPKNVAWRIQLASYYSASGRPRKAVELFTELLEEDQALLPALRGRADALLSYGKHSEAIRDYEKGLEIEPKHTGILNNLAWVLATSPEDGVRDAQRSIKLATLACEETEYKEAHILSTLAAGYAEAGDFETAIKWSTKAVELGAGTDVEESLRKELESYRQGKVWREKQETEEKPDFSTSDLET